MATKQTKTPAVKTAKTVKRKTVDNDDLSVVVRETVFGLSARYEIVQNFGKRTGSVTLLKSNNQLDKEQVKADAIRLAKKLNVTLLEIRW